MEESSSRLKEIGMIKPKADNATQNFPKLEIENERRAEDSGAIEPTLSLCLSDLKRSPMFALCCSG